MGKKRQGVNERTGAPAQTELVPLVDKLYTDFSIEALEERLETDPLMLTGLFDEITPYCVQCKKGGLQCDEGHGVGCNGASPYESGCYCHAVDSDIDCFKLD